HDHDVHAFQQLGLERRGAQRGGMRLDRAQVGEQAQALADRQQALLRPHFGIGIGPLGAADRTEQDRVGLARGLECGCRQRLAVAVDRDAADVVLLELEAVTETAGNRLQYRQGGGDDLRTDAVTGEDDDVRVHSTGPHGDGGHARLRAVVAGAAYSASSTASGCAAGVGAGAEVDGFASASEQGRGGSGVSARRRASARLTAASKVSTAAWLLSAMGMGRRSWAAGAGAGRGCVWKERPAGSPPAGRWMGWIRRWRAGRCRGRGAGAAGGWPRPARPARWPR